MARVCIDWFPKTNGFYMGDRLKLQIDVLLKNITKDWDFTIIITGQGEVRVGKSMLALQVGCYWTYEIWKRYKIKCPFNLKENIVFEGSKLIKAGNTLGMNHKYSCIIFDEAGADLEGRKIMSGSTQDVLDYFRECGQYNLLNILVLPEYFDLPKGIALTRSIFLLDVSYAADENADGDAVTGQMGICLSATLANWSPVVVRTSRAPSTPSSTRCRKCATAKTRTRKRHFTLRPIPPRPASPPPGSYRARNCPTTMWLTPMLH